MDIRSLSIGDKFDETAAVVALLQSRVVSPPHRLSPFLEEIGSAVKLVQLSEEDRLFARERPTHDFVGAVLPEDLARAAIELREWQQQGIDVRTVLDTSYPDCLRTIFNKPPILFVEGSWKERADSNSVAVVGTRSASPQGLSRAARLSRELVESGFSVISGLAAGIDASAHTTALEAGGRTIAVMGTGISQRYPASNRQLAARIVDSGGGLLSQFFPDQGPRRWTFPQRNVTMSGLTLATVVVEASATSGARMQARVALQHGRTVFLLRSLVESHSWARKYVEEGAYGTRAILISSPSDIIERLRSPVVEPLIAVS